MDTYLYFYERMSETLESGEDAAEFETNGLISSKVLREANRINKLHDNKKIDDDKYDNYIKKLSEESEVPVKMLKKSLSVTKTFEGENTRPNKDKFSSKPENTSSETYKSFKKMPQNDFDKLMYHYDKMISTDNKTEFANHRREFNKLTKIPSDSIIKEIRIDRDERNISFRVLPTNTAISTDKNEKLYHVSGRKDLNNIKPQTISKRDGVIYDKPTLYASSNGPMNIYTGRVEDDVDDNKALYVINKNPSKMTIDPEYGKDNKVSKKIVSDKPIAVHKETEAERKERLEKNKK